MHDGLFKNPQNKSWLINKEGGVGGSAPGLIWEDSSEANYEKGSRRRNKSFSSLPSFHVPNTCTTVIAQLAPFYNPLPSQQSITSQTEPRLKLAGEVSLGDEFVKKRHNGGEE